MITGWTQRALAGIGVAAIAAVLLPAVSAASSRTVAGDPQLSISVDDGRDVAAVGDALQYTITVTNTGSEPVAGLVVTQSMPTGLVLISADSNALPGTGSLSWTTDLSGGQKATFASSMTVGSTDDSVLRLASVACAALTADGPPIVCAADSDLLPSGAAAAAQPVSSVPPDQIDSRWYVGAGSGVVIVAGLLVLLLLQRRRDRTGDRQAVG